MSYQWTFICWLVLLETECIAYRATHVPPTPRETVQKYMRKRPKPEVGGDRRELRSVVAELLLRRRDVVTVVPCDVGADAAAALAPPIVIVSSQTGGLNTTMAFGFSFPLHVR